MVFVNPGDNRLGQTLNFSWGLWFDIGNVALKQIKLGMLSDGYY